VKTILAGMVWIALLPAQTVPADQPAPRADKNSQIAHEQLLAKAKQGRIDVYFEGDSITRRWGATDYPELLQNWKKNFFGWNAADFGWGADRIENILWRLENGELDNVNPKVIVLLGGTNNVGGSVPPEGVESAAANVTKGLAAVVRVLQAKAPNAVIIVMGIFPRNDNMAVMPVIDRVNANLARMADGRKIRYLSINDKLADADGKLREGMMNDRDKLHPQLNGYQVWADALKPVLTELLGPPASEDHAPPPTGDPSAQTAPKPAAPVVPDWALPGSATHRQVPPPADFHRPSRNFDTPIGVFQGQSDIGSALVPGSASYDAGTKQYTINSAGYNIWYSRDEFRYLWKKVSGDVSLAADVAFPDPKGYGDRKAVLVIRQNLDDDSKEVMAGQHGAGMIHLAHRPEKGADVKDMQFRFGGSLANVRAKRIGIEKQGDAVAIFISLEGEPMHQFGPPVHLHFDEPFYVGIGFCSHLPDQSDTAVLSNVVLENAAGKVK
jgi:lysophospholipase L1-like esterase